MDERTANHLRELDVTCERIARTVARGRDDFYELDLAFDACQMQIVHLNTDLERLGPEWIAAHPGIPRERIRGLRNRISHDYDSVNAEQLWEAVSVHVPALRNLLAAAIDEAKRVLPSE